MTRSNCVVYALTAWLKAAPPGQESYLVIRRSRVKWGIVHFLHGKLDHQTNQIEVLSYKPFPENLPKRGLEPLFEGSIRAGDKP